MASPVDILWAEDNRQDQYLIRSALDGTETLQGLRFANDGLFLLEALQQAIPDLVILDLKMPRLGGLDTLRRIRQEPHLTKLPVCVFSAGNQPHEIDACLALGALDVVQKPVEFKEFTRAVRSIVGRASHAKPTLI